MRETGGPRLERVGSRGLSARVGAAAAVVVLAGAVALSFADDDHRVAPVPVEAVVPSAAAPLPTLVADARTPAATDALTLLIGGPVRLTKPDAAEVPAGLPIAVEGSAPARITTLRALISHESGELGRVFLQRDGDEFRGAVPIYPPPGPGSAILHIYDAMNEGTVITAPITLSDAPPVSVWTPPPGLIAAADEVIVSGATLDRIRTVHVRVSRGGAVLAESTVRTERAFAQWRTFEVRLSLLRGRMQLSDATVCVAWGRLGCGTRNSIEYPVRLSTGDE